MSTYCCEVLDLISKSAERSEKAGYAQTSYLLISSISSSIWCSAPVGADEASPCSAFEMAKDSREEKEGLCCRRGAGREKEDVREFMALCGNSLLQKSSNPSKLESKSVGSGCVQPCSCPEETSGREWLRQGEPQPYRLVQRRLVRHCGSMAFCARICWICCMLDVWKGISDFFSK